MTVVVKEGERLGFYILVRIENWKTGFTFFICRDDWMRQDNFNEESIIP